MSFSLILYLNKFISQYFFNPNMTEQNLLLFQIASQGRILSKWIHLDSEQISALAGMVFWIMVDQSVRTAILN